MSTNQLAPPPGSPAPPAPRTRQPGAADAFMRRLLRISATSKASGRGAERAFRLSLLISCLRCVVTYLAVPILIPIAAISGWIAAPISFTLSIFAIVSASISLRKMWAANHRFRWVYTAFIGVVFLILAITLVVDIRRLAIGL